MLKVTSYGERADHLCEAAVRFLTVYRAEQEHLFVLTLTLIPAPHNPLADSVHRGPSVALNRPLNIADMVGLDTNDADLWLISECEAA